MRIYPPVSYFFWLLPIFTFCSCLPSEINNFLPKDDPRTKNQIILDALKLNFELQKMADAEKTNTVPINMDQANDLRDEYEDTECAKNSRGALYHFPKILAALLKASNVTRVEELTKNTASVNTLTKTGFFAVFGKYSMTNKPSYMDAATFNNYKGKNTSYISFALIVDENTVDDMYYNITPRSGNQSVQSSFLVTEPIMFNFGKLCPTYCPPSLGSNVD